ncbi:MAG: DUF4916 domain-containing protein [Thermoproteota archaeon]|nr:DUF4916 domain-containing protein [Thermoproteota archaeon]
MGVNSGPIRDPRMHAISVTFISEIVAGKEDAKDDVAGLHWISIHNELDRLIQTNQIAFDHAKILNDYKNCMSESRGSIDIGRLTFWSTKDRER